MAVSEGNERIIRTWSTRPYTGIRKRRIVVERRLVAEHIPGVGVDLRLEVRSPEREIEDWRLAEAWEFRDHGIDHYKSEIGRGLP